MNKEEKEEMELNIEAKYVGRTEKEFLNNITYAECLYILDAKNNYCDDIKNLSLLKIVDIISKLQKELEQEKEKNKKLNLENQALFENINCNDDNMLARRYSNLQKELDKKDKVIDKMAKTIAGLQLYDFGRKEYFTLEDEGEVKEYFYKKVEEENE